MSESSPASDPAVKAAPFPVGDLVLGCAITIASLWAVVVSARMPRPEGWSQAPGLFPLVCGLALLGMGLFLTLSTIARRRPSSRPVPAASEGDPESPELRRILLVVGSVVVYVLVLIPLLHYTVGTFVYLVAVIWYFWRGNLLAILAIALAGALFLSQTFEHAFAIILP
jgi:hypothetical protein